MGKLVGVVVGLFALTAITLSVAGYGEASLGQARPGAQGKVGSIDAAKKSFVVESKAGSKTVATTDKTEFTKQNAGKLADVKEKDIVSVAGRMTDDMSSIDAAVITIQAAGSQPGKAKAKAGAPFQTVSGTVMATGDNMKIKTRDDREVAVKTTAETRVLVPGKGTFDDIKVGSFVNVQGRTEGDNVEADRVTILSGIGKGKGKGN